MEELKQRLVALVKDDLAEIESALKKNLNPYLELTSQVASHLLFSGGKRLRPLLMVLCAKICGYTGKYDKVFSTIFEYLHAATLLHDDLVDEATMRRGKPVAHKIWDNPTTVLTGDFLLARSLSIAAETKRPEIIRVVAEITENMSQGEIQQLMRKGCLDVTESEYMDVIKRKTAFLFKGACRSGALIADAPENKEEALALYGLNLGIAFQMADDLLDYTLDSYTLGKTVGADLREGKLTLPVIYALNEADPKDRSDMEEIIKNQNFSVDEFETLIGLMEKYGGQKYTRDFAAQHITNAKEELAVFEPSQSKEILLMLADYSFKRSF